VKGMRASQGAPSRSVITRTQAQGKQIQAFQRESIQRLAFLGHQKECVREKWCPTDTNPENVSSL
jgi:hypothetical protein